MVSHNGLRVLGFLELRWLIGEACNPLGSFSACLGNRSKKEDFAARRDFLFYEGE